MVVVLTVGCCWALVAAETKSGGPCWGTLSISSMSLIRSLVLSRHARSIPGHRDDTLPSLVKRASSRTQVRMMRESSSWTSWAQFLQAVELLHRALDQDLKRPHRGEEVACPGHS